MHGFVQGQAGGGHPDRVVVAKRLKQPFTRRDSEAEPWQDLAKPINAHPDVVRSRDRLAVSQADIV